MKNLVIKTIVITISSIICFLATLFGALCVFAPTSIASVFENMGCYKESVFFYELKFEQSNDIDDLIVLVDKAYGNKDNEGLEEYLGELIWHKNFFNYCKNKDTSLSANKMPTKDYYVGYYAKVLIENGKFESAINMSASYVEKFGYTEFNPIRTIVNESFSALNAQQKEELKQTILAFTQNDFIIEDLNKIN